MNDLEIIFNVLINVLFNDKKSNEEINEVADRANNLAYVTKNIYGVLENKIYIDYMIRKLSSIRIKKIHPSVLTILEIGIYNIHFLNTKDYAVVNELVDLTKKKNKKSSGFVNGILRNFIRDEEEISKIKEKDDIKSLSIRYSLPYEITKYINDNYGLDYTKDFLRYINKEQEITIRVNLTKISRENLKIELEKEGFKIREGYLSKNSLRIENPAGLAKTSQFRDGLFTIQQESSMKSVEILNPTKKSTILDLCAAPGTKTSYIAEFVENDAEIIANDISKNKLHLIEENIERLELKNIKITNFDATITKDEYIDKFDYVLVDAPCSGLGVMGRKPEIRYNRSMEDIKNLSTLQREILDNAVKYLKKGGELVYSTCTIGNIENKENFNYLKNNKELEVIPVEDQEYLEYTNFIEKTDGFFISKFKKR